MKRIANNVALQTILYVISGNQKIKVIDYDNPYDESVNQNGRIVFEGFLKDFAYDWRFERTKRSTVYGINNSINEDGETVLEFQLVTKYEEY